MQQRTPLHVACDQDAPAVVIQALLKEYPEASIRIGTSNMNPLHITCSSQHASAHVVRVLLENGIHEQFSMRDVDGDTPLHAACRCGAPIEVLELLLKAHPAAVMQRDFEGLTPLQRLWVRYTVILGSDMIESVNCAADLLGQLLEAWRKTELLLRCAHHGAIEGRVAGANPDTVSGSQVVVPFRAVHAAAAVDCPRFVVKIAAKVYPHQLDEKDEQGRTPLLIAAAAPIFQVHDLSDEGYTLEDVIHGDDANSGEFGFEDETTDCSYPSVIDFLLQSNSETAAQGAFMHDPLGRLPVHIALQTGKRWNEGVRALIEASPDSVGVADPTSGLYPFMIAACGRGSSSATLSDDNSQNSAQSRKGDIGTTFELLRLNPSLIELLTLGRPKTSESLKNKMYF